MPINARTTTTNAETTRLDKSNATTFTVIVANQSAFYELNVAPYGRGENWAPNGGALLTPGMWNFTQQDWQEYGVSFVQGIRFRSVLASDPSVVTVS